MKPDYYKARNSDTGKSIDCMDLIAASVVDMNPLEAFFAGNVLKYLWRMGAKDTGTGNAVKSDIAKALTYLEYLYDYAGEKLDVNYEIYDDDILGLTLSGTLLTCNDFDGLFPDSVTTETAKLIAKGLPGQAFDYLSENKGGILRE